MSEKIMVAGMLVIFLLAGCLGLSRVPGPYGDNARYIILAQSLIQGKGLAKINFPEESVEKKVPIVYPLILASLILLFGLNMLILKASSMVFMGLALVLFYLFMRRIEVPRVERLIVLFLSAICAINLEYSREVLSESLFVLLICAAALAISIYEISDKVKFLLAGVFLGVIAFFTRDAAIIALLAIAVILFRKKKAASFCAVLVLIAALVFSWFYKNSSAQSGYYREFLSDGSYLSPGRHWISAGSFLKRYVFEAIAYIGDVLPDFIFPVFRNIRPHSFLWPVKLAAGAGLFSLVVFGVYRSSKTRGIRFFLIFPVVYLACLPLFPTYGLRYLVPAGFFLFLFLVCALAGMTVFRKKSIVAGLLCAAVLGNAVPAAQDIETIRKGYPGAWANYYQALSYLKEYAALPGPIICRKPFLGYLLSGHKTLGYRYGSSADEIFADIQNSPASYVIVDGMNIAGVFFSQKYLKPVIEEHKDRFELIYKLEDPLTEVYEIKK